MLKWRGVKPFLSGKRNEVNREAFAHRANWLAKYVYKVGPDHDLSAEQRHEANQQFLKIAQAMEMCAAAAEVAGNKVQQLVLANHQQLKLTAKEPRPQLFPAKEKPVPEKEPFARVNMDCNFAMWTLTSGSPPPVSERPKQESVALIYRAISGLYPQVPGYYAASWETEQRGSVVLRIKDGKLKQGEAKRWEYLDELFMALMALLLAFCVRIGCADSPCPSIVVDKESNNFFADGLDVCYTASKPAVVYEFYRAVVSAAERGAFLGAQTRLLCDRMWSTIQNVIAQRSCSLTVALIDIMQRATIFDMPSQPNASKGGDEDWSGPQRRRNAPRGRSKDSKPRLCWQWRDEGKCSKHASGNCIFDHPAKDKKKGPSKKRALSDDDDE